MLVDFLKTGKALDFFKAASENKWPLLPTYEDSTDIVDPSEVEWETLDSPNNLSDSSLAAAAILPQAGSHAKHHAKIYNNMKCGNKARKALEIFLFEDGYRLQPTTEAYTDGTWQSAILAGRKLYNLTSLETLAHRNNLVHGSTSCNSIQNWWRDEVNPQWMQRIPVF